jgi:hypothetical protein
MLMLVVQGIGFKCMCSASEPSNNLLNSAANVPTDAVFDPSALLCCGTF